MPNQKINNQFFSDQIESIMKRFKAFDFALGRFEFAKPAIGLDLPETLQTVMLVFFITSAKTK